MKRLALILTILIAAASCALSAADAPKRQGWDYKYKTPLTPLYGNVESLTITEYSLKDSLGVLSRSKIEVKNCFNFNESGDVTERAKYNSDGSLNDKFIYKYDKKGNMTEYAWYKSDGSFIHKYIYKYDKKGNMTEIASYNLFGLLSRERIYEYDKKGNKIKEVWYNSDGSFVKRI